MLEYVFFDERPCNRFVAFVRAQGLQPCTGVADGVHTVSLPEDLPEDLGERLEACYDEMMAWNQELFETEGEAREVGDHSAGITLQLRDGSNVYAQVDPQLLGRIMQVLTVQELNQVVNAIVEAVENPDARSLCQRVRDRRED